MAEWLRRSTRNRLENFRVGSSPAADAPIFNLKIFLPDTKSTGWNALLWYFLRTSLSMSVFKDFDLGPIVLSSSSADADNSGNEN